MPSRKPEARGPLVAPGPSGGAARPGLRVTLVRSLIGLKPNHVRTVRALGLRRIRATVQHPDTPAIRGMVGRVAYALRVEEVSR